MAWTTVSVIVRPMGRIGAEITKDVGRGCGDVRLVGDPVPGLVLHHVVLAGSDRAIGGALAEVAIERHGLETRALLTDARYARARRAWFGREYPIHSRRAQGVASAFALDPDDDRFDFSILPFDLGTSSGGALIGHATYAPAWTTGTGHGLLARSAVARGVSIELYVMDWRPRSGHQSIALHAFDLLSGTIIGVNSAGIAVAAVAAQGAAPLALALPPRAIGCHELQLLRLVLDSCATVDEAQAALLGTFDCRLLGPARYLIADATGRSFVYERESPSVQRLIDGEGDRQDISSYCHADVEDRASASWMALVDQEAGSLSIGGSARDDASDRSPAAP